MYIDAHCHLDLLKENPSIGTSIKNCKAKGVGIIVTNGTNPETNRESLKLSKQNPEVKAALGIYPTDGLKLTEEQIGNEVNFIKENNDSIVAIGEVGLDYKETDEKEIQIKTFKKFIDLSKELDKPLIIHSRKAEKDCIEILEEKDTKKVIMHCFSGNFKLVQMIIDNGWTLTIPTSVKRSQHFQKIIELTPLNQLLCETDAPFMHPDKEFPNQPANVIESYKKISEIKKISLKEVEKQLEKNYNKLF